MQEEDHATGWVADYLNALGQRAEHPQFVFSNETLKALEYEQRVSSGCIPTRDCAHDWYNGLIWISFPFAKKLLNDLHLQEARESLQSLSSNGRSRRRDALTLFDESGAILLTTQDGIKQALSNFDWVELLVNRRSDWNKNTRLILFGHGLLDSLHHPYKGLCAKVRVVTVPQIETSNLEDLICKEILALKDPIDLLPLPVMGVPGWFAESEQFGFYEDVAVFRPKPTRRIKRSA